MANDSASGGYLLPTDSVVNDDALEDLLQSVVVGITGLPGDLVRPRWQPDPPPLPDVAVNWCAIGSIDFDTEGTASIEHDPDADAGMGQDDLTTWETFDVVASFYGPNSQRYAGILRDGLQIGQNREAMWLAGNLVHRSAYKVENRPDLRNDQWVRRYDVRCTFARAVNRTYTVRNLLTASGTIETDNGLQTTFDTVNASP